jgi:hypothetical protein
MDVPLEEFVKEGYDPVYSYRNMHGADTDWRDLEDYIAQVEDEFRCSNDDETDIDCPGSRHCESKSVATKFGNDDGTVTWIGWTYWYGGGKHGEPGAIEWIDDAYYLDVEEVVTTVLKFKKKETP